MHIPDGFLTPPVWLTLDVVAVPIVGWIAKGEGRAESATTEVHHRVPLLGVMGSFVFAAQMINFPIGLGTSSHLLGGTLLAVTLGPSSAALVMTAVLILQALLFQDGGVLALGANICNMALVGVLAGYIPVRLLGTRTIAVFLGGFVSVAASAALALGELHLSGVEISGRALAVAVALPLIAGILEGVITVGVLRAIVNLRRTPMHTPKPLSLRAVTTLAGVALMFAVCGTWIASAAPDTLQHLANDVGLASNSIWHSPFAGYEMGITGPLWLRKSAAGLAGLALVYAVAAIFGRRRL